MSMKPQNIKRASKMLPVPKDDYVVWDDVLSQLGRRVRKSRETWIVQARVEGKTKRRTLGVCGEIKVEAARVLAQAYLDELTRVWTQLHHCLMANICSVARKFWLSFSNRVASLRMSFILQKNRSTTFRMA